MSVVSDQQSESKVSGLVDEQNDIEHVKLEEKDIAIQDDPKNWSRTKKSLILATVSVTGMLNILSTAYVINAESLHRISHVINL